MEQCKYIDDEPVEFRSKIITKDRPPRVDVSMRLVCKHPKHPYKPGITGLKCGGDVAKCHLSREQFFDVGEAESQ